MKRWAAFFLAIFMLLSAASAQELRMYYVSPGDGFDRYVQENPSVSIVHASADDYIPTTDQLLGQLLTGEFDWDVFAQSTRYGDPQLLMRKGYCADLSGSEVIRSHVERMWPAIANQLMMDGKIYGVPTSIQTDMLLCNESAWAEAGYTPEDVPSTYPEMLAFLNAWADRQEEEALPFVVISQWDETLYNRYTYARWLVEELLTSHITQQQFTGEPLRFATQELIALLDQARDTGLRLYNTERIKTENSTLKPLFLLTSDEWGSAQEWLVSLRLRQDQPRLLPVILAVTCVRAGSDRTSEGVKLLEDIVSGSTFVSWHQLLFYQDAQPIPDPDKTERLAYVSGMRDILLTLQSSPDTPLSDIVDMNLGGGVYQETFQHWYSYMHSDPDPDEVQEHILSWTKTIGELEQNPYIFSAEQLSDYAAFVYHLCFPVPGPFSANSDGGEQMLQLAQRFAQGQLSAVQLTRELDRMAQMIEMENQ